LRDLPLQKNPSPLCHGSSPSFIFSHVPTEIFLFYEMGKKWGNTKRIVSVRGGSCTCVFSWGLGTPLGSCPWVSLPQENALVQEPPLQLYSHCFSMPCQNFVREICSSLLNIPFQNWYAFAFYFV
jgi:hypothetical protein